MKIRVGLALLFSQLWLLGEAAEITEFAYRKLVGGDVSPESLNTLILDAEVFRHTREGLPDLRLFVGEGEDAEEVPFLVERIEYREIPASTRKLESEVTSFQELGDGGVAIEVQLDEKSRFASSFRIDTPLHDFQKSVRVFGIMEGGEPNLLVDGLIVDQKRFLDYRRTTLALPENSYRHFRVVIAEATERQRSLVKQFTKTVGDEVGKTVSVSEQISTRQFRIDSLSFFAKTNEAETVYSAKRYPISISETIENEEEKQTEIYLDSGMAPLDTLTLITEDKNFSREVELQYLASPDNWRRISRHKIFRFSLGDFEEERLHCDFPETRREQLRLVIRNGDSPPLKINRIVALGASFEMRFFAEKGKRLRLYFCTENPEVTQPSYDLAALRAASQRDFPTVVCETKAMEENPDFRSRGTGVSWLNHRWFLWGAIALVVLALTFVLMKTAGQINEN